MGLIFNHQIYLVFYLKLFFDEAEISFKIHMNKLGETSFDNLAILWYDEENHKFVIVDSILNSTDNTVSAIVPHFSKYESGLTNTGEASYYVTIITKHGTSELISAFPTNGIYPK